MSFLIQALKHRLGLGEKVEVRVVGLDRDWKVTYIQCCDSKAARLGQVHATDGYTTKSYVTKGKYVTAYHMNPNGPIRPLWVQFRKKEHAIIFVLDSTNPSELIMETEWMDKELNYKRLRKVPIMIYARLEDYPEPMSEETFENLVGETFTVCPSFAFSGPGAEARTQWLADMLRVARKHDTLDQNRI